MALKNKDAIPFAVERDLAKLAESGEQEAATRFAEIFSAGKMGLNRQREFMRLVFELAKIKDLRQADIFELAGFKAVWQSDEPDMRRKAIMLLDWLYNQRYPHIAQAREQAAAKIKALKLDNRLSLNMPENFENLRHFIQFGFASKSEMLELLELIKQLADDPNFDKLFERD